jgi:hypothetical protein
MVISDFKTLAAASNKRLRDIEVAIYENYTATGKRDEGAQARLEAGGAGMRALETAISRLEQKGSVTQRDFTLLVATVGNLAETADTGAAAKVINEVVDGTVKWQ